MSNRFGDRTKKRIPLFSCFQVWFGLLGRLLSSNLTESWYPQDSPQIWLAKVLSFLSFFFSFVWRHNKPNPKPRTTRKTPHSRKNVKKEKPCNYIRNAYKRCAVIGYPGSARPQGTLAMDLGSRTNTHMGQETETDQNAHPQTHSIWLARFWGFRTIWRYTPKPSNTSGTHMKITFIITRKRNNVVVWNSQGAVFYTHRSERLWFADCRHIFYFSQKKRLVKRK